ncbi:hypothetical protein R3W88_017646 [Solanum pinnatisectum]|uniref:NAC domain-containing protein n=1 Tax=Solanum pinnatisectum TaxID=50273 RepID=A0AAV9L237_9SOLN|nr:hypothetical protein R3W88_017646 [Solanum pinnatisectum]
MSGEEEWKQQIPADFKFCPTDEEMLQYYLLHHVTGNYTLPGIIYQFDLYEFGSELGKKTTLKYRFKNSAGGRMDNARDIIAACKIYKKKIRNQRAKELDNSLIGPNLLTTDHNNGEPQPSLKRKFKTLITSDQPHDTTMNSNYLCDSHAALILDGSVPLEIDQTSNTNPTPFEIGQTSYTNPTLLEIGQTLLNWPNIKYQLTPPEIGQTSNTNPTPLEIGLTSNTNSTPLEIGQTSNTNLTPPKIVQTSNTSSTPPEFGQTSNTNSTPPQDNTVLTGGVYVGPTNQALTNIYQNQSNEGKIEGANLDFDLDGLDDILLNRSPPDESFEKYWQSLGI